MLKKDELMQLTNVELSSMCKERKLPVYKGKTHMNKAELVNQLLNYAETNTETKIETEKPVEVEDHRKAVPKKVKTSSEKRKEAYVNNPVISPDLKKELQDQIKENDTVAENPWRMGNKDKLIEEADVGTLIAFLDNKGKPRTAKMINRSSSRRVIKLVTEFGWEFIVPYDNVLWVLKYERWPKAIYNMLKEYKNGKPVSVVYEK